MRERLNNLLNIIKEYDGKVTTPVNVALNNFRSEITKALITCDEYSLTPVEEYQWNYTVMFMIVNGITRLFDEIRLGNFRMDYSRTGATFYNTFNPTSYCANACLECLNCKYAEVSKYVAYCHLYLNNGAVCPYGLDKRENLYERLEQIIMYASFRIESLIDIDSDEKKIISYFTKYKTKCRTTIGRSLYNSLSCVLVSRLIEKYPSSKKLCNQLIQNHC